MDIIFAALRLLTRLFEALKAYLELKGSGRDDGLPDARTTRRPKHLKG